MYAKTTDAPFTGRRGHLYAGDIAATTHLEQYDAFKAFGGPSGFSGNGWALVDSATGEIMYRHAWRNEVLAEQARRERNRAEAVSLVANA